MKLKAEIDAEKSPLSKRENEILALMAQGMTRPAIAEFVHRSKCTIDNHVTHIFEKLDADNSTQAVAISMMSGFLRLSRHLCVSLLISLSVFYSVMPADSHAQPLTRVRVRGRWQRSFSRLSVSCAKTRGRK